MEFVGIAKRLEDVDIPREANRIDVGEDELHAVMDVEAAGSGFDSFNRPKMLFEPHIFYRELGSGGDRDRAVKEGLAYSSWKRDYPKESYTRLGQAMEINPVKALRSCSWGAPQIMGFNHSLAGYNSVEEMIESFKQDEENHLKAMIQFIISAGLDDELRRHDWRGFARGYNGSSYAIHGYHTRLESAYKVWAKRKDTPWFPELNMPGESPIMSKMVDQLIRIKAIVNEA